MWLEFSLLIIIIYIAFIFYYRFRSLPAGVQPPPRDFYLREDQVRFLYDLTRYKNDSKSADQHIFSAYRDALRQARHLILFDIFLFNDQKYDPKKYLPVPDMVKRELGQKIDLPRYFITDPLNTAYHTNRSAALEALARTGTKIIFTDLDRLPDNNLLYSGWWRMFLQWFGTGKGLSVTNPLRPRKKTTIRAILKGLNAKANHRKLLVADDRVIVSSSNLSAVGSWHSNTGLLVEDKDLALYFLKAETALAKMSGADIKIPSEYYRQDGDKEDMRPQPIMARPLLGSYIKSSIVNDLQNLKAGDRVFIGMLFIADRRVLKVLKKKARQGVEINLVLDDNSMSFSKQKSGLPNLYAAPGLIKAGINVRVFKDQESEYHAKMVYIRKKDKVIITTGSANLTRRSLIGANPENNLRLEAPLPSRLAAAVEEYTNKVLGPEYSQSFQGRPEHYYLRLLWLRLAERIGLASW